MTPNHAVTLACLLLIHFDGPSPVTKEARHAAKPGEAGTKSVEI
jgi:hypothetical protein